ncbi:MAG: DeoR/GlpR family DNA-binding transcription regulator [Actinomycetota bacterium]
MANAAAANRGRTLFQSERHREIVARTLQVGRVDVAELAVEFDVTAETIRRDLSELQNRQLVRRVHGGAVPWQTQGFEPLLAVRNDQQVAEKRRMAAMAVQELPDSGTIIIDSGSTLTVFAEHLPRDRAMRVVTNSLLIAQVLAENEAIEVVVLPGKVRKNTLAMVDSATVTAVAPLNVDTLFISSDGMSPERGLTTPYREEAALKRTMVESAGRVVALVDFSKQGKDHLVRFANWTDVDVLVTDSRADEATAATIEAMGPTVLRA